MLSSLLTTIMAYPNYLSLGALVMSVFFAGTFLQGERLRKQEIKDELREIQQLAEQTMARVEDINTQLSQKDAQLVGEISEAYQILAELTEKERLQRVALEESARRRNELSDQRQSERQNVNNSAGFIIDNN